MDPANWKDRSILSQGAIEGFRVSSVLNRDVTQFGKQHLFDCNDETCWNSEQGTPQFISVKLRTPIPVESVKIMFQGGFSAKTLEIWTAVPQQKKLELVKEYNALNQNGWQMGVASSSPARAPASEETESEEAGGVIISGGLYQALVKRSHRMRAQRESQKAAHERLGDLLRQQKEELEKPAAPLDNQEMQTDHLSSVSAGSHGLSSNSDEEDSSSLGDGDISESGTPAALKGSFGSTPVVGGNEGHNLPLDETGNSSTPSSSANLEGGERESEQSSALLDSQGGFGSAPELDLAEDHTSHLSDLEDSQMKTVSKQIDQLITTYDRATSASHCQIPREAVLACLKEHKDNALACRKVVSQFKKCAREGISSN